MAFGAHAHPAAPRGAGQVIVWVAVMLPLFFSVVGLAIDAGSVFAARRELQNATDGAARAGAMQLDIDVYRQSSGENLVLDGATARQIAAEYLADEPTAMTATVTADRHPSWGEA